MIKEHQTTQTTPGQPERRVIFTRPQVVNAGSDPSQHHPHYDVQLPDWMRLRDCIQSESVIKSKREKYLPRPAGMTGEYQDAYEGYIDRAHYPQICAYALQGALGVIITKLPEFNVPPQLEYILGDATKEGESIKQFFMDIIIEIFLTGKCPIMVDIDATTNKFKFVKYRAENFINWKEEVIGAETNLILAVMEEAEPASDDIFSHDTNKLYRVLTLDKEKNYVSRLFSDTGEYEEKAVTPSYMGKQINEIPLFVAGSINNSLDLQPIPLLSVANCSIQIYRKEADLSNSEYLSCNPTLCMVGASNDDDIPNVVGSSVMIVLPDPQARIFYTETDTAALSQVKEHITDLYDEAIRHGVAILDTRKGVESAEALRIRQATQSASIYSTYLSAVTAISDALKLMCDWAGYDKTQVDIDAPSALTYGIPDSNVIREIIEGFGKNVIPVEVIHRYLVGSGLLDQTVSLEEYMESLVAQRKIFDEAGLTVDTKGETVTLQDDPAKAEVDIKDKKVKDELQGATPPEDSKSNAE